MENFGNPKDCMNNVVLIEYSFQIESEVHLESSGWSKSKTRIRSASFATILQKISFLVHLFCPVPL
jgi:hypothetical protein